MDLFYIRMPWKWRIEATCNVTTIEVSMATTGQHSTSATSNFFNLISAVDLGSNLLTDDIRHVISRWWRVSEFYYVFTLLIHKQSIGSYHLLLSLELSALIARKKEACQTKYKSEMKGKEQFQSVAVRSIGIQSGQKLFRNIENLSIKIEMCWFW